MRRWLSVTALVAALLGCTPLARAGILPSLSTTITMDCTPAATFCNFNPGSLGSPEQGMANFNPVAPGWSADFKSAPAISWGVFVGVYQAEFGPGGDFSIAAPDGMEFLGTLTSGIAFEFPVGFIQTVASFQGYWNNGLYANGVMVEDPFGLNGPFVTLSVTTTATPEPGSFFLFGSALAGLAGIFRRTFPG